MKKPKGYRAFDALARELVKVPKPPKQRPRRKLPQKVQIVYTNTPNGRIFPETH